MTSNEMKLLLASIIRQIENVSMHDMSDITVDSEWSTIEDPAAHLESIRRDITCLAVAVVDKTEVQRLLPEKT